MEKVIINGLVAVLVSPCFGAGWSTWFSSKEEKEAAIFCPALVKWVEDGKPDEVPELEKILCESYTGGLRDLQVLWVEIGTRFEIEEYDGSESLRIFGQDEGFVA